MKNKYISTIISILVFTGMLFSCKNIYEQTSVNDELNANAKLKIVLSGEVRTAMPDLSVYKITLTGIKEGTEEPVEFINEDNFSFNYGTTKDISLSCGVWSFDMTANNENETIFYSAEQNNVTIVPGENELKFELKITDINYGDAEDKYNSVYVEWCFPESENGVSVAAADYTVYDSENNIVFFRDQLLKNIDLSVYDNSDGKNVKFYQNNLPAGKYKVIMKLYSNALKTCELNTLQEIVYVVDDETTVLHKTDEHLLTTLPSHKVTYHLSSDVSFNTEAKGVVKSENDYTIAYTANCINNFDFLKDENVNKFNSHVEGWYSDPQFADGTEVTEIDASRDMDLWPKWAPGKMVSADKLLDYLKSLTDTDTYKVIISDANPSLGTINKAITDSNVKVKVDLDLSRCTELTAIDHGAFSNNAKLVSISIPANVTSFEDYAFHNCEELTNVTFVGSSTLTYIGERIFAYCSSLSEFSIPASVTTIAQEAFMFSNITSIAFPDSVTEIPDSVCSGCSSLETVTLGNAVTSIGRSAFSDSNITSIVFPDSLTQIPESVCNSCQSLTTVTLGNAVTSIGTSSFYKCKKIESLSLPATLNSIGDEAFYLCTKLTDINIPEGVTEIGEDAFNNCSITSIALPANLTSLGEGAFAYCEDAEGTVTIPEGLSEISDRTFMNCSKISAFEFAETPTLEIIGDNAFYQCEAITEMELPSTVQSIGDWAFGDCSKLEEINFPENLTSIGENAFLRCSALASIDMSNCKVTEIKKYTFSNCNKLSDVSLPETLVTIGEYAFNNCFKDGYDYIFIIYKNVKFIAKNAFKNSTNMNFQFYDDSLWYYSESDDCTEGIELPCEISDDECLFKPTEDLIRYNWYKIDAYRIKYYYGSNRLDNITPVVHIKGENTTLPEGEWCTDYYDLENSQIFAFPDEDWDYSEDLSLTNP